ncbi:MAG: TetR/AcrR family transcriptional regulator [Flammeovirgaceae bacterium]
MGRKALEKERKQDSDKQLSWVKVLYPYLQENGLQGITMNEIAKILNKSKTTVYEYFQSKEEMLNLLIEYKLSSIRDYVPVLKNSSMSFAERYRWVMKHLTLHISDVSTLFLSDLKKQHPALWIKVHQFLDDATRLLEEFYKEGIKRGEFNDIHPSILSMSDRFFFRALSDPDFLKNENLTLQQAFDQYLALKFFGLMKKKSEDT